MKFGIKPFSLEAVHAVAKDATITGVALNPLTSRAHAHIGGFTAQIDIAYTGVGEHRGKLYEIVEYELDEGCLAGATKDNGTKRADVTDSYGDPHGTDLGFFFKGDGTSSLLQYWSNGEAPIPNSGYTIIRLIRERGENEYALITRQYGSKVTIGGKTVEAGAGSVTCFQKITRASDTSPPVIRLVGIW